MNGAHDTADDGVTLLDLAVPLAAHWKLLVAGSLAAGLAALGITYAIAPRFVARTSFLPPQQQQSSATAALAALGPLGSLAGALNVKSPSEQYVSLLQSQTVMDRLIEQFDLIRVYEVDYPTDARRALARNVAVSLGKKDGLITVEVEDKDPKRAAEMANRHVDELRRMTANLALTEAQQRRVFFEGQLQQTRDRLTTAQQALQGSGFNAGALKAEPRAAAEGYARLRAEAAAAEVRLQALRRNLAGNQPEVQQQEAALGELRRQLALAEQSSDPSAGPDYVTRYREFKYQETLFELFARQYELARVDESREGTLIQVIDIATPPEKKRWPRRGLTAVATTLAALLLLGAIVTTRHFWRESASHPRTAARVARLRSAVGRR